MNVNLLMDKPVVNGKSAKLCKYYATNGHCFYGENCQFVHAKGKIESPLSGEFIYLEGPEKVHGHMTVYYDIRVSDL